MIRCTAGAWLHQHAASVEGVLELGQLLVKVSGIACASARVSSRGRIGVHISIQVQVTLEIVLRVLDALHVPGKLQQGHPMH